MATRKANPDQRYLFETGPPFPRARWILETRDDTGQLRLRGCPTLVAVYKEYDRQRENHTITGAQIRGRRGGVYKHLDGEI